MLKQSILIVLILILYVKSQTRHKTVRIYQFKGNCPDHKDAPIQYTDIKLLNVNRTFHISMKVTVRRDIPNGLKLYLYLGRCSSRDALDSCETYNTIKINHFCNFINAEKKPWSSFVKLIEPPMNCPLKEGVYVVKNGTFDGSSFDRFSVSNWYWKVKVNVLDEVTGDLLLCAILEGQIAPI